MTKGRLTTIKPAVRMLSHMGITSLVLGQRISGRRLQRIRERVLARDPICLRCKESGLVSLSTQVDHIVALINGGSDHPTDDSNRQGLCDPCHVAKTVLDLQIYRGEGG